MKCSLIFAGGGTKGMALAGALHALKHSKADIVAYGGCSAGSIVATLGATGMDDEKDILAAARELHIANIHENVKWLRKLDHMLSVEPNIKWCGPRDTSRIGTAYNGFNLWKRLQSRHGLSGHSRLRARLNKVIRSRDKTLRNGATRISFEVFQKTFKTDLRIIATDLSQHSGDNAPRLRIFSAAETPKVEVATAVAASCSFPIVFQPVRHVFGLSKGHEGVFVDGGVASNAPIFLFDDLARHGIHPILVDLVNPPAKDKRERLNTFGGIVRGVLDCLDTSDELLRNCSMHHTYMPIRFNEPQGTFDLDAKPSDLFYEGKAKIHDQIQRRELFTSDTGNRRIKEMQQALIARYGAPEQYGWVLKGLCRGVADVLAGSALRNQRCAAILDALTATLYLPSEHAREILPVYVTSGKQRPADRSFAPNEGPVGTAWAKREKLYYDRNRVNFQSEMWSDMEPWPFTPDAVCGVAIPILPPRDANRHDNPEDIGTGTPLFALGVILLEYCGRDRITIDALNGESAKNGETEHVLGREIESAQEVIYKMFFARI